MVLEAHQALDFYTTALPAKWVRCYQRGPDRHVGHAEPLNAIPAPKERGSVDRSHALLQHVYAAPGAEPAEGRGPTTLSEPEPPPGRAFLLEGPVGAGKSTLSRSLVCHRPARAGQVGGATPDSHHDNQAPRVALTLDEWMTRLFQPDRPREAQHRVTWYLERAERYREQIWHMALALLRSGVDVVLELGLLTRAKREAFYDRLDQQRCRWTLYVVEAPRKLRRKRVLRRNTERGPTFSMIVPPEIFELASDLWEPVDEEEARGRDVRRYASG